MSGARWLQVLDGRRRQSEETRRRRGRRSRGLTYRTGSSSGPHRSACTAHLGASGGPNSFAGASPPRRRIVGAAATRLPRTIHRCGGGRRASTETAAELVLWSRGGHRLERLPAAPPRRALGSTTSAFSTPTGSYATPPRLRRDATAPRVRRRRASKERRDGAADAAPPRLKKRRDGAAGGATPPRLKKRRDGAAGGATPPRLKKRRDGAAGGCVGRSSDSIASTCRG